MDRGETGVEWTVAKQSWTRGSDAFSLTATRERIPSGLTPPKIAETVNAEPYISSD